MNERIKELAEQAGFEAGDQYTVLGFTNYAEYKPCHQLKSFAELIRQDEREACAKLCDKASYWDGHVAANCAAAIRARSNHEQT